VHLIIFDVNYFEPVAQLVKDYLNASHLNDIVKTYKFFRMFELRVAYDFIIDYLVNLQDFTEYQILMFVILRTVVVLLIRIASTLSIKISWMSEIKIFTRRLPLISFLSEKLDLKRQNQFGSPIISS